MDVEIFTDEAEIILQLIEIEIIRLQRDKDIHLKYDNENVVIAFEYEIKRLEDIKDKLS